MRELIRIRVRTGVSLRVMCLDDDHVIIGNVEQAIARLTGA
jgi:hypothetical protein